MVGTLENQIQWQKKPESLPQEKREVTRVDISKSGSVPVPIVTDEGKLTPVVRPPQKKTG